MTTIKTKTRTTATTRATAHSRSLHSALSAPVGMTNRCWDTYIRKMRGFGKIAVLSVVGLMGLGAFAQQAKLLQPKDTSALHPPAGAKVAIVEFADLECPMCARENPVIMQAVDHYHVAWLRHDFPLPMHNWSFQAAVNARWFDTKSIKLGNDYRDYIFANQISIETPDELRNFTQKFAQA